MHAEIKVSGIVQGVGFRPFVYRVAVENVLTGYVRNRGDAIVEIVVEGKENNIKRFLGDLKRRKPPFAKIYNIVTKYTDDQGGFENFTIETSSKNAELSGSIIPPDISICNECLKELRDPKDERHNYFFITCTNCGPRFTTIRDLPYDRFNTTMTKFPMCDFCSEEYRDPLNRRFHAQTVACSQCGPKAYLATRTGALLDYNDPIREAGKLLEEGRIVAIKGNGGFHVATATTQSKPIERLRNVKHRTQKPFAIMARDLQTVKSFSEVNPDEAKLLVSYLKPIVLLKKRDDYYLSELISPGLHNVGVMLPYTGLHVMLFDRTKEPAFVMTSANPPSEPIVTENDEAIKKLGSTVEFFLVHNRPIAQRCDDSVVRLHGKNPSMIRRSRGYAPAPIHLKHSVDKCALGVGAEENVTSCVLLGDKAFISQFIGDVENVETLEFLKEAINHLLKLVNSKVDIIACDLHPKFATTKIARDLGSKLQCPVVPVQHHHAHLAALIGEHSLSEIIAIVCDGFGYGSDGTAWGGEILYGDRHGFQRLGHLQEQPMAGGDLATLYPLRMAAGILYKSANVEEWVSAHSHHFPHGKKEVEVLMRQLERDVIPKTTSCGRILDAVSAILGICYERTYEGEPAMKLESAALGGRDVLNLQPKLEGNTINTTSMIEEVFRQNGKHHFADLAHSAQSYIAKSLAQLAMEKAEQLNITTIGFSGGVAYNEEITSTIKRLIEENGFKFVVHRMVPPGDGGISFGQAMTASFRA